MDRIRIIFISLILIFGFSLSAFAQQTNNNADVKNTCEVSGGTWHESASGWACCWSDWGCYGCTNGICKIKCHNARCRRANGLSRVAPGQQRINGLAPAGMADPIVPIIKSKKSSQCPCKKGLMKSQY